MKGIIYLMTTAVNGLIKIGKSGTKNYNERMRFLEANGYHNVVGLKKFFAIELSDYGEKEKLLHEVFEKHKVGDSELFAIDKDLVKQLLLSFDGKIIYPQELKNKEKEFNKISQTKKINSLFSFYKKGIKKGETIFFTEDENFKAKVLSERDVEFEGKEYKLSTLVYQIQEKREKLNTSGAYQGAAYFKYNGKKLKDLPDLF